MKLLTVLVSSVLVVILAIILGFRALNTFITPPVATDEWWGPSEEAPVSLPNVSDISIEKMAEIHFEDDKLADLNERLANARYFRSLENTSWEYGSNIEELKKFVRYLICSRQTFMFCVCDVNLRIFVMKHCKPVSEK